jgi:pimeloyl-ACP methyl ester carboxylesterase
MRAIAPDLRGFGESDRPDAVEDYAIARSVDDMVALVGVLGIDRAHVVGHDFGAAVAWELAARVPERVDRLVAMSVPHPSIARLRTMEDREKAWYVLLTAVRPGTVAVRTHRRREPLDATGRPRPRQRAAGRLPGLTLLGPEGYRGSASRKS